MILAEMKTKDRYLDIHPAMKASFAFLDKCFAEGVEPGEYPIDGDNILAKVFRYELKEKANPQYETHDDHIDIQCMLRGTECQWYIPRKELKDEGPYNAARDLTFYSFSGEGSKLVLEPGDFAIYFPEDGHLPAMLGDVENDCVRIVIKIKC